MRSSGQEGLHACARAEQHRNDPAADRWLTEPIGRRRALFVLGGTVLAISGAALVLEGCGSASTPVPSVWIPLDIDPASLPIDAPTSVAFTFPAEAGESPGGSGSTWLVRRSDGSLVAYDPRCTHAVCAYRWSEADARFDCLCHKASFALDGAVMDGPPPRPLDRFALRTTGSTVEIEVPGDLVTPRP